MSVEIVCPQCGYSREIPEERIPPGVKWATCPRCRNRFELKHPERGTVPKAEGFAQKEEGPQQGRSAPPWERRSEVGFWNGLYLTSKEALFSPRHLFATMEFESGLKDPLAFGLLTGAVGAMAGQFWLSLIIYGMFPSAFPAGEIGMALSFMSSLLLSIPCVILLVLLESLILHGLLFIVRGARNGFEATFRVVAYSQATQVLSFIPFLGEMAALIWLMVVQMIGLKEIHGISYGRIALACLIPILLLLAALIGLIFVIFGALWR